MLIGVGREIRMTIGYLDIPTPYCYTYTPRPLESRHADRLSEPHAETEPSSQSAVLCEQDLTPRSIRISEHLTNIGIVAELGTVGAYNDFPQSLH
jgi:hypothetical protein